MSRHARCLVPGVAYHVTQRGSNRQDVFFKRRDRLVYLDLLARNIADCGVHVYSYCLMTNHIHMVVRPDEEDSMPRLYRRLQSRYASYVNLTYGRTGHLWHNRYYCCMLDEPHLWNANRYVERNPVRAGIVERPADYEWSSTRAHLTGVDPTGVLDMQYWQLAGGAAGWRDMLADPDNHMQIRILRKCTYAGKPCGSQNFLEEMEARFDRKWRRLKCEQPLTMAAS